MTHSCDRHRRVLACAGPTCVKQSFWEYYCHFRNDRFRTFKNTNGQGPPETVRSAVESDSLICAIRQTKKPSATRPCDGLLRKDSVGSKGSFVANLSI